MGIPLQIIFCVTLLLKMNNTLLNTRILVCYGNAHSISKAVSLNRIVVMTS